MPLYHINHKAWRRIYYGLEGFCQLQSQRFAPGEGQIESDWLSQYTDWLIGLVGKVFANGSGDLDSIPGCIIPKTLKMVLDASLLNTQQYKVGIKGKVEQSWERSSALPYTSV